MLSLEGNVKLTAIPDSFFDGIQNLQVVNLSNTRIRMLPTSFFGLSKLQALVLRDCPLFMDLPPEIGDLEHLELLDLQGTDVNNLPNEVGKLGFLKILRVSFYGPVECIKQVKLSQALLSHETISSLLLLNELSISARPGDPRWNNIAESVTEEVTYLKGLISLHFYFPDADILELFIRRSASWTLKSLTKFKFVVGLNIFHIVSEVPKEVEFDYDKEDRCLRYMNGDSTIHDAIVRVLNRASAFYLDNHFTVNSLSEFGLDNMKELKFCIATECPCIQVLVDANNDAESVLPLLERLSMHCLWNLKSICKGLVPRGSFNRLKSLSVHKCPKLTYVFTETLLDHFSNLEELVVEDCESVKAIVKTEADSDEGFSASLTVLNVMTVKHLPELRRIGNGPWSLLEQVNIYNCPKLNLGDFFRSAGAV
ncbi:disease resistance protein RUN1-like [Rhododendron vialii]|uniref:disease resistance protein RUN1-like n=1 Tax=Rhododendron vialii TaxID=182163 RepID=UPI00265FA2D3|nr:disease resistance protein RUN1-like [Rhododendron vialii]